VIRYKLYRETEAAKLFLQACYEPQHDGIIFTPLDEDACEYVTVEKAAQVARSITKLRGFEVCIQAVDDGK
jgi:hypothetical protein